VESDFKAFHRNLEREIGSTFNFVGREAVAENARATPVGEGKHGGPGRTAGHARDAHGYAVIGEDGGLLAGGSTLDGHSIPTTDLGQSGQIVLAIVNLAEYWLWIEIGARGVPGRFILTRCYQEYGGVIRAELGRGVGDE
jgi:hypothetical protein